MSHRVDVMVDAVRIPLARRRVDEIARAVLRTERAGAMHVSITFVKARRIAALNARHLGHRGATDVISFALPPDRPGGPMIGDIYIAPEIAKQNAEEHHSTFREEIARLVVHGVLHVLGYDHPQGRGRAASRMWRRQETLLASVRRLFAPPSRHHLTRPAA